jgi:hypothetical protein
MFENSTVNINALCNSCEDMACSSECVLTFLHAGDYIQYVNEQFVSCLYLQLFRTLKRQYSKYCYIEIQVSVTKQQQHFGSYVIKAYFENKVILFYSICFDCEVEIYVIARTASYASTKNCFSVVSVTVALQNTVWLC